LQFPAQNIQIIPITVCDDINGPQVLKTLAHTRISHAKSPNSRNYIQPYQETWRFIRHGYPISNCSGNSGKAMGPVFMVDELDVVDQLRAMEEDITTTVSVLIPKLPATLQESAEGGNALRMEETVEETVKEMISAFVTIVGSWCYRLFQTISPGPDLSQNITIENLAVGVVTMPKPSISVRFDGYPLTCQI
jgi:hypothetical protein